MSEIDHERWSEELSAYLLGALQPAEAEALEQHLEGCQRCREEMRWLAPALDALPETVTRMQPPPGLRERLLTEVREDARRAAGGVPERRGLLERMRDFAGPRWRPLAAGAAVLLIVAAVVGYEIGTNDSDNGGVGGGPNITVESEQAGVLAAVSMEGTSHGRIKLSNVPDLPPNRVLEAWVERDGEIEAVPALFVPDGEGRAATTIGDMSGVTAVMVTKEPPSGSESPTSDPIATVSIPTS
jgi:hypothetical protein